MSANYELKGDSFCISNYQDCHPVSSFLPGLCGEFGVPLWCFYVNRGQCIASFGVDDRDHAIMEFSPAVIAYEDTARKGFRTFVRANSQYFELFSWENTAQIMSVQPNQLTIEEERNGFRFQIEYALLPDEQIGALMRTVTVENLSDRSQSLEMLDGLARILPYGVSNSEFKEMANLLKSYSVVHAISSGAAIFSVRAGVTDTAEVKVSEGGYFCYSSSNGTPLPLICDSSVLFGADTGLDAPRNFYRDGVKPIMAQIQHCDNKIPCAFAVLSATLKPGESRRLNTLIGFTPTISRLEDYLPRFSDHSWLDQKRRRAATLVRELTDEIAVHTAEPALDAYFRQCYLDNILRGGWPQIRGGHILHLFSRKHGDLERDYNFFQTQATHCSQGNGNFRDVCQNRRSEVLFHPEAGEYDLLLFANLIQIDGYNPLELRPEIFRLRNRTEFDNLCRDVFGAALPDLASQFENGMTPGELASAWLEQDTPQFPESSFLDQALALGDQEQCAIFKEGYWSDHWCYVPELADQVFAVWPDRRRALLFEKRNVRFYDSPVMVCGRSDKHCLKDGHVRQYGAVIPDTTKSWTDNETHWLKNQDGTEVRTTLFGKFLLLATIKCATLDPLQLGIELEAGKPGWNDAFNGLPGLCGSSTSETVDLLALIERMLSWLDDSPKTICLPKEIASLCNELSLILSQTSIGFERWNRLAGLRERWRAETRHGLLGSDCEVSVETVYEWLTVQEALLTNSLQRLEGYGTIPPTYFSYEAVAWTPLGANTPYGLPAVRVEEWRAIALPIFLETPAKLMRRLRGESALHLYDVIRQSELFDPDLEMYKTSGPIDCLGYEVGRIRAFTPGWFERESVFLHMEYKYLLAMLDAGLYEQVFEAMRKILIPFLNPATYGRSILENSSFLASTVNPDPAVRGKGFISRLSGSTAEMISLWQRMFLGNHLFQIGTNGLEFQFAPILPNWLFTSDGTLSFVFMGCDVTYHNPTHKSGALTPLSISIDGSEQLGGILPSAFAESLRYKALSSINVLF